MAIQRWDPLRDLIELQERIKKLFDDALSRSTSPEGDGPAGAGWRPPLDVFEEPGRYVVRADLPGISTADLEIQIEGDVLHLRGERRTDPGVSRESYLRVERPTGRFAVQLALPPSVDREAIEARHENGVIEVSLPKRGAAAPSRVPITSA